MTPPNPQFQNLIRTDFWFNDGNIVLIAQNAAFKAHKGQLARHSEVFSDLFALPQPLPPSRSFGERGNGDAAEEVDLIDGCPFVILQDSPSDVFYFLSALYDGLYFTPPRLHSRPHSPTFPSLSAVLRLSSKYLVDPLVQRCLFHLSLDWPLSLAAWDEREARFTIYPPYPSSSPPSKTFGRGNRGARYNPRQFCPHPILVIQLALEMNLPGILPAAMYDLSRYGPSKILNGTTTPSTTFDRLVAQLSNSLESDRPKSLRLSRNLFCQILRGREESQRFLASFVEKELYSRPPSPYCQNLPPPSPSIPTTPPNSQDPASTPPSNTTTPSPHPIETQNNPCSDSFYFILLNVLRSVGGISFCRDADSLFTLTQAIEMLDRTDFYISGSTPPGGGDGGDDDESNTQINRCRSVLLVRTCVRFANRSLRRKLGKLGDVELFAVVVWVGWTPTCRGLSSSLMLSSGYLESRLPGWLIRRPGLCDGRRTDSATRAHRLCRLTIALLLLVLHLAFRWLLCLARLAICVPSSLFTLYQFSSALERPRKKQKSMHLVGTYYILLMIDPASGWLTLWEQTWNRKEDTVPWFYLRQTERDNPSTENVPEYCWVFSPSNHIASTITLQPSSFVTTICGRSKNCFRIFTPNLDCVPGAMFPKKVYLSSFRKKGLWCSIQTPSRLCAPAC